MASYNNRQLLLWLIRVQSIDNLLIACMYPSLAKFNTWLYASACMHMTVYVSLQSYCNRQMNIIVIIIIIINTINKIIKLSDQYNMSLCLLKRSSFYFFLLPKSIENGQFFVLWLDDTSLTLCSSSWFLHCDSTKASLVWANSSSRFRNLCSEESSDEWFALSSSSDVLPSLACMYQYHETLSH